VNLDAIPFAAIERVEDLKDGALAIYAATRSAA
jgi:outer membrane receptor protein involved in Fe transport